MPIFQEMSFFRYDNSVNSPLGFAIAGASIAVLTQPAVTTNQPGTPLATIYTASTSNAATVTAASFANGYISFTLNTVPADVVIGSYISVVSASPAGYNGIWQVVSVAGLVVSVETPYQTSAPNPGTWVSGGTVATSALPNPFLTDNIGNYFFYASSNLYTVQEYDTLNRIIPKVYLDQDLGFTAGGGSVISVAETGDGVIFDTTVAGSPITTSGTLVPALLNQSANRILAGPPSGGVAPPTFRALVAADLPSSGVGSGTVTSVAATIATDSFVASSITGSPITASGTLAINVNFSSQAANFFLCGPASGGSAAPTFRAIVPSDLPPSLAYLGNVQTFTAANTFNANVSLVNPTAATSLANSPMPNLAFNGHWWDGAVSQTDSWTWSDVYSPTFGPASNILSLTYAGGPGGPFAGFLDINCYQVNLNASVVMAAGEASSFVVNIGNYDGTSGAISSVATAVGSLTTYTGVIGTLRPFAGMYVTFAGFVTVANNGRFIVQASSPTTITVYSAVGVAEVHAATWTLDASNASGLFGVYGFTGQGSYPLTGSLGGFAAYPIQANLDSTPATMSLVLSQQANHTDSAFFHIVNDGATSQHGLEMGAVIDGTGAAPIFLRLGKFNGVTGTTFTQPIQILGSSSGAAVIQVAAAAGTPNPLQLPTTTGIAGEFLVTDGNNPQQTSWSNAFPFVSAPATSSSAGVKDQMAYDGSWLYICTATNTWLRTAIATW